MSDQQRLLVVGQELHPPDPYQRGARPAAQSQQHEHNQTGAFPCIDDLVPKERARKSLLGKGRALVSYGVGSLGKPMLRFQRGWKAPLRTEAVHGSRTQKGGLDWRDRISYVSQIKSLSFK
jgi:hypothetical protein